MNKHYYYGSLVLVFLAFILSIIIRPGADEIAFMQMEDGNIAAAFGRYQAEAAKGSISLRVVMPLTRIYLYEGDIDNAIITMERFAEQNPKAIDARKQLGELYKSAERMDDYLHNLEVLMKLAPSIETAEERVRVSHFLGRDAERKKALEQLIHHHDYIAREEDYTTLAMLYANDGNLEAALHVMARLLADTGYRAGKDAIGLTLHLAMDSGDNGRAFSIASIYLETHHAQNDAASVIAVFRERGALELAWQLAAPFLQTANSRMFEEIILTQIARGKKKEAMEMAAGSALLSSMPKEILLEWAEMTVMMHDKPLTQKMMKNLGTKFLATDPFYTQEPNANNAVQLVEDLLTEKRYREAFPHVTQLVRKTNNRERLYVEVVTGLAQQHYPFKAKEKQAIAAVIGQLCARPDATEEEKRDSAYLLKAIGNRDKAQRLFFALAKHQQPASADVEELLSLAGDNPGPTIRQWLKERAATAKGQEQALWFAHLNAIGENRMVLLLAGDNRENDAYREAVKQIGQLYFDQGRYDQAGELFAVLTKKDSAIRMMEAQIAYRQGKIKEASAHYHSLLAEQPDNKALRADFADMLIEARQFNEADALLMR